MKPLFVKVILFDPTTDAEFSVVEGIEVEVVRIHPWNPTVGFDSLKLTPHPEAGFFSVNDPGYEAGKDHHFRVGFRKANFSRSRGMLLGIKEVRSQDLPLLHPARFPYWDTGWRWKYKQNEFFSGRGVRSDSSPDRPLVIRIPLREIFLIGHRGAPHHFPENTLASFQKAIDIGANGLEFDLCLTKDGRIVVFHDPKPIKLPPQLDRTLFENLPFELVSPSFFRGGTTTYAVWKKKKGSQYVDEKPRKLGSDTEFDIRSLSLKDIWKYYHYDLVKGIEHTIPDLRQFLKLVSSRAEKTRFLFFDVKNPAPANDESLYRYFGTMIGEALRSFSTLPARLVICNPDQEILRMLRESILATGETRCEYGYDASGGLGALFGISGEALHKIPKPLRSVVDFFTARRYDPLRTARRLNTSVVSIGSLARPGSLEEIVEAVLDRDYNESSSVNTVVHWTVNDPAQMLLSLNNGVNGIVTDYPDVLADLCRKLGVVATLRGG